MKMLRLSDKWIRELVSKPETGMGYQVVSIILKTGTRFDQVVIDSGYITRIRGVQGIPFEEEDIKEIVVTHDKWDFDRG